MPKHEERRGPEPARGLERAVAQEARHRLGHAGPREQLPARRRCAFGAVHPALLARGSCAVVPQRQAQRDRGHERHLHHAHHAVASRPAGGARHLPGHDHGSAGRADAPAAVQPVHVARRVVRRHKRVQRRVHGAGAQAVRDGPEHQLPQRRARGEAKQRHGRHGHGRGGEPARPQAPHEPVGHEARHYGPQADDNRYGASERHGGAQVRVHGGPGGAQKAVGEPKAHEREVDDGKECRGHGMRAFL